MSGIQRVHFTLDIDPVSDPIAGSLGDLAGQSVEFAGWLGFAAALEELLSAGQPESLTTPELCPEHPPQP